MEARKMDSLSNPQHRSRRCWLQFSLSNLLLLTLLAAVMVGWQRERLSRWVEALWHGPDQAASEAARRPPNFVVQAVIAELEFADADWPGVEPALQDAIAL